jgi:G-protein alpha subunit.
MGCGMSTEDKEGKARNDEIENQLKRDRMQQRNEIKMLLLGTCCRRDHRETASRRHANKSAQAPVNPASLPSSSR